MPTTTPKPYPKLTLLRRLRERAGFDRSELCRRADLFANDLASIEAGRRKCGPKVQSRIGHALGVEPDVIFNQSGWPRYEDG